MKKFLALYMAPAASLAEWRTNTPPEEQKAAMAEWGNWMAAHASDFADIGQPAGKTKRINAQGVTDIKNDITGYGIVQAESHEDAAKKLVDHPNNTIPGGYIELMELLSMEGM